MRKFLKYCLIIFIILASNFSVLEIQAQSADRIIKKSVDAIGGEDALNRVIRAYIKGRIVMPSNALFPDIEIPIELYMKKPDNIKMIMDLMLMKMEYGLLNGEFYILYDNTSRDTIWFEDDEADIFKELLENFFDFFTGPVYIVYKSGLEGELLGEKYIENENCYVLKFRYYDLSDIYLYISKKTNLLVKKLEVANDEYILEIENFYSNYNKVGSILMPLKNITTMDGQKTATIYFDRVKLDTLEIVGNEEKLNNLKLQKDDFSTDFSLCFFGSYFPSTNDKVKTLVAPGIELSANLNNFIIFFNYIIPFYETKFQYLGFDFQTSWNSNMISAGICYKYIFNNDIFALVPKLGYFYGESNSKEIIQNKVIKGNTNWSGFIFGCDFDYIPFEQIKNFSVFLNTTLHHSFTQDLIFRNDVESIYLGKSLASLTIGAKYMF